MPRQAETWEPSEPEAEERAPGTRRGLHAPPIPNRDSTAAALLYRLRYGGFWFQAVSRILAINGFVGLSLWAIDEATQTHSQTLLLIRGNLLLTLFVAALVALAFAGARLAITLDPREPLANLPALILVLGVILAVTSIAGPGFVAAGEAGVMVLTVAVIQLRKINVNPYVLLKAALVISAIILVAGLVRGIFTGEILQTRVSPVELDGVMRLFVFLLGVSVYFIEEHRHWQAAPPTPVVVDRLHRACQENDFSAISRWLGPGMTLSHAQQHLLASLVLPRRLIVDGDFALAPTPAGGLLCFRVERGQVHELREYGADPDKPWPRAGRSA
ncbi:MAG: hypothetical protein ACRDHX_12340 [Chloroflexota bacterium]